MSPRDLVLLTLRRLARREALNLVPLARLRASCEGLDRETVDAVLLGLRLDDEVRLSTEDGRHRQSSAEDLEAAIVEGGRVFTYAVPMRTR